MRAPLLAALAVLCPTAQPPVQDDAVPVRQEDVRFPSGELTLAGLLLVPEADAPAPAAVVLQGAGDSDRSNAWSRAFADELAARGLVVLLTDKRGCGASGGSWKEAGFGELADDALAAVAYLAGRDEVDAARVGLVGLSQGGWVAPVAAARSNDVAFVIDVSGAAVGFAEQVNVEMANTARQAGLAGEDLRTVLQLNQRLGRYLTTGDWESYSAARAAALGTPARPVAAGFPAARDMPIFTFLRRVFAFDPMPHWSLVTQPVLAVFGAEDEHDNVPVAESVRRLEHGFEAAGKTDYAIVVVPGAGHAVLDPSGGRLAPELLEAFDAFLGEHVLR